MAQTNYSFTNFSNATAKAIGKNLPISTKAAINVCSALRGLRVEKALAYLDDVIALKRAIPYTRFTDGVGHRKGPMASGRYPVKAASEIRAIIASAAANAANNGLAEELKIVSLIANKASSPLHQGRQRRRAMKRTHIEVVVKEIEEQSKTTKSKTKTVQKNSSPNTSEAKITKKEVKEKVVEEKNEQPAQKKAETPAQEITNEEADKK